MASDIHLEFWERYGEECEAINVPHVSSNSPVLCLLGDIGYPLGSPDMKEAYQNYLFDQSERFEHVMVVTGNHEYWSPHTMEDVNQRVEEVCAQRSNLHFLNEKSVVVGGVRWAGCTLWTAVPENKTTEVALTYCCNDYKRIHVNDGGDGKRLYTVADMRKIHARHVEFLENEIEKSRQDQIPLVVLTHHAPSFVRTLKAEDKKSFPILGGTDLEKMFGGPVKVWGFGHTHRTSDQVRGGTRLVSNQFGYCTTRAGHSEDKLDPEFSGEFVIDIEYNEEEIRRRKRGWRGEGSDDEEEDDGPSGGGAVGGGGAEGRVDFRKAATFQKRSTYK